MMSQWRHQVMNRRHRRWKLLASYGSFPGLRLAITQRALSPEARDLIILQSVIQEANFGLRWDFHSWCCKGLLPGFQDFHTLFHFCPFLSFQPLRIHLTCDGCIIYTEFFFILLQIPFHWFLFGGQPIKSSQCVAFITSWFLLENYTCESCENLYFLHLIVKMNSFDFNVNVWKIWMLPMFSWKP